MRKHLVVVGVAASALLLAGGVAATSAGAEENPDVPGLPFAWPGLPGWSDFYGSDDDAGAEEPDHDDADMSHQDDPDQDDPDQGGPDNGDPDQGDQDRGDYDDEEPVEAPPARPAQAQRPAPAQRPAQQRPARAPQQPQRRTRQQAAAPAADLAVAARRPVTAADVSANPSAPVQLRVLELINQNRRRGGCDSVALDRRLIEAAIEHATDMARRRYFAHRSPNGDNAGERVRHAGYRWKRYGENIARGADSPYEVVNGWMNSPHHRENILDCSLKEMGVGLAISRGGTTYWVQNFATPMK